MALINGTNNNDQLFGTSEDDLINGLNGNDQLFGDAGKDILDGGTGSDTMRGGSGDDSYLVDSPFDVIIENPGDGIDTVFATSSFALGANVENLLIRTGTIGTGNDLNNRIELPSATLTSASSVLFSGLGGDDTLISGVGSDTLDGGTGNDVMNGGGGNDLYKVDSVGDIIQEESGGGIDTIESTVSYTLSANVENLTLKPFGGANDATGNELNNVITGNLLNNRLQGLAGDDTLNGDSGADTLDGGTGNDRMLGGLGNDVYIVTDADDIVDEGTGVLAPNLLFGGLDLVRSSVDFTLGQNVENLTLEGNVVNGTGNELNNEIIGNGVANVLEGLAGNDRILGGNGNDILRGGLGNDNLQGDRGKDVMTGGDGADRFFFDLNSPYNQAAIGKDVIKDFTVGVDKIVLDQTTFGPISRADIAIVTDNAEAAISVKKIVYSEETGKLFFNANGDARGFGNGGYFATLQGAPSLAVSDIVIQP